MHAKYLPTFNDKLQSLPRCHGAFDNFQRNIQIVSYLKYKERGCASTQNNRKREFMSSDMWHMGGAWRKQSQARHHQRLQRDHGRQFSSQWQ